MVMIAKYAANIWGEGKMTKIKFMLWRVFLSEGCYKIKFAGVSVDAYWNGLRWSNKFRLDAEKVGLFVRRAK